VSGFDPDAVIDAMAPWLGRGVTPENRPAIRTHLLITAGMAERVLAFPLDDHEEPAPVFTP
jgi:hypothetical protein